MTEAVVYERLDKGCRAKILADLDDKILIRAWWPAGDGDRKKGLAGKNDLIATNVVEVSRDYFIRKYGEVL